MQGWTDYPIEALGDKNGELAPVRACEVLHYDGNKYVKVRVGGVEASFKAGYLYRHEDRLTDSHQPRTFSHEELLSLKAGSGQSTEPDGWYSVGAGGRKGPYFSLRQAMIRSGMA